MISSSWRETIDDEAPEELLMPLSAHIIGSTPVFKNDYRPAVRQREVMQWLHEYESPGWDRFCVLDDMPELYSPGWAPLLLCGPRLGIDKAALDQLVARVRNER